MLEGAHAPMRRTLQIPADVTLLLSRQALSEYSLACEAAQIAAEQCGMARTPSPECLAILRDCRARVMAAEGALTLVADAIVTREGRMVSLDDPGRHLIGTLVGTALCRMSANLEAPEEEILAAADRIQRLRALLHELGI